LLMRTLLYIFKLRQALSFRIIWVAKLAGSTMHAGFLGSVHKVSIPPSLIALLWANWLNSQLSRL